MKVVYNACYGGFGLSHAGVMRYAEIKGMKLYAFVDQRGKDGRYKIGDMRPFDPSKDEDAFCIHYSTNEKYGNNCYWSCRNIDRADPALVQVVEELGKAAGGLCSSLAIEDVPAGTAYRIDEYDGNESVMTQDSYEWKVAI